MNRGFIFSITALFGAAIVIMLSGIMIVQLEFSSQSNSYPPLNLDKNDTAIVNSYFNLASADPGNFVLSFVASPGTTGTNRGIAGVAREAKNKLTLARI